MSDNYAPAERIYLQPNCGDCLFFMNLTETTWTERNPGPCPDCGRPPHEYTLVPVSQIPAPAGDAARSRDTLSAAEAVTDRAADVRSCSLETSGADAPVSAPAFSGDSA